MKTYFISALALCCLFFKSTVAQYWIPSGGRASSMGNASVAFSDPWSVHNNQAGMGYLKNSSAGLYFENHYYLKDLSYQMLAITLPTRYGVFGSCVNYSGNTVFNTMKTGLAYARLFGYHFAAGIQLDLLRTQFSETYGSRISGTFEAGVLLQVTDKLNLGVHVFNPLHVRICAFNNERVPTVMSAGLAYSYSGLLLISTEVMKNSETPMEFLGGLEYKFFGKGFARLGLATAPLRYSFGAGFITGPFAFDISSSYHETLGFSPQASLQYGFGK
jgi:hypothetical protein